VFSGILFAEKERLSPVKGCRGPKKEGKVKKILLVVIAALTLCCMACGVTNAQEDEGNYAFGEVVQVTANSIKVTEVYYDEDTGEEVVSEVEYQISSEAELENVGSLAELKEGQEVDIEYVEVGDKKEASYIYVYAEEE
jgi:hypothetical protein